MSPCVIEAWTFPQCKLSLTTTLQACPKSTFTASAGQPVQVSRENRALLTAERCCRWLNLGSQCSGAFRTAAVRSFQPVPDLFRSLAQHPAFRLQGWLRLTCVCSAPIPDCFLRANKDPSEHPVTIMCWVGLWMDGIWHGLGFPSLCLSGLIYHCFYRAGRNGMAITMVTQYDIHLVHAIEEEISKWGA